MGENIFTTQTPASQAGDGPYTLATLFKTTVNGQINGVRWWSANQAESGRSVGLFRYTSEAAGTLLASQPATSTVDNGWNFTAFTAPVSIVAGQLYAAAYNFPRFYVATGGFFAPGGAGQSGITNGHLFAPPNDAVTPVLNGRFHVGGASLTWPETGFNGGCYFIDVDFTATASSPTQGRWGIHL